MGISVSYQVSNSILNKANLKVADKHNERKYKLKSSEHSNSEINPEYTKFNKRLVGTKEIYKDVEKLYNTEFLKALQDYNFKQKRNDRKIYDYFEKISDSKTSLYTEIIVQIGDKDFWKTKDIEEKKKMIDVFEKQLELSNEFFPNFKVVNAIIHLDETSPHMHIVGVPVSNKELALQVNEKKKKQKKQNGLDTYVCQSEIFTAYNLKEFHQIFSEKSLQIFNEVYKTNEVLNDKQLHQEHLSLAEFKKVAPIIKKAQKEFDDLKREKEVLKKDVSYLKNEKENLENLKEENKDLIKKLTKENEILYSVKSMEDNVEIKKNIITGKTKVTMEDDVYKSFLKYAREGEDYFDKNKELKIENKKLKTENEKLKTKNEEFKTKNEEFKTKNEEFKTKKIAYEDKINDYISRLEKEIPKEKIEEIKKENSSFIKIKNFKFNYEINNYLEELSMQDFNFLNKVDKSFVKEYASIGYDVAKNILNENKSQNSKDWGLGDD